MKAQEQLSWFCFGVFDVNYEMLFVIHLIHSQLTFFRVEAAQININMLLHSNWENANIVFLFQFHRVGHDPVFSILNDVKVRSWLNMKNLRRAIFTYLHKI